MKFETVAEFVARGGVIQKLSLSQPMRKYTRNDIVQMMMGQNRRPKTKKRDDLPIGVQ